MRRSLERAHHAASLRRGRRSGNGSPARQPDGISLSIARIVVLLGLQSAASIPSRAARDRPAPCAKAEYERLAAFRYAWRRFRTGASEGWVSMAASIA